MGNQIRQVNYFGVTIVPQQQAYILEYLGRYSRSLKPGLNFFIPLIQRVRIWLSRSHTNTPLKKNHLIWSIKMLWRRRMCPSQSTEFFTLGLLIRIERRMALSTLKNTLWSWLRVLLVRKLVNSLSMRLFQQEPIRTLVYYQVCSMPLRTGESNVSDTRSKILKFLIESKR